ncbi:MAG: SDR family NAD(P)-dependent oxidoreductase, partial [Methylophilaceae bacterium]
MNKKKEKVAFISGANRGIGFETAKGLGETGITVVIGVRDIAKGDTAVKQLQGLGIKAEAIHYDAAQPGSENAVFEHLASRYGKLDI